MLLLGDPEAYPGQIGNIIPSVGSGPAPGSAWKTSKRRHPGGILIRCPDHLSLSMRKSIGSTPLSLRLSPATLWKKLILAASSCAIFLMSCPIIFNFIYAK